MSEFEKRFDKKLGKLENRNEERINTKFDHVLTGLDASTNPSRQYKARKV